MSDSLRERVAIRYLAYMQGLKMTEAKRVWENTPDWERADYLNEAALAIKIVKKELSHE